ncbi:MAG: hypothetical protein KAI16_02820 [Candidatus Pacebacteria bacterium]|nr:hypothetical protein [Candidatus Paceibacterota bacterium]
MITKTKNKTWKKLPDVIIKDVTEKNLGNKIMTKIMERKIDRVINEI